VEGENRINKLIGGPKKTIFQLFNGLNERSEGQNTNNLIQARQVILIFLRQHAGPFALQACYKQMQQSLFYETEVVRLPNEVRSWQMINIFENDRANVSVNWLIEQVTKRGLIVRHLLRVKHTATSALYYIVVLPDGRYLCNCCMPLNIGIPCRHYFRIWIDVQGLPFHISLIRPRQVLVLY
ncbi:hypothetical protein C8J57DRAFT_1061554, partial [Mycena rebaudengoi]